MPTVAYALGTALLIYVLYKVFIRLRLSRAKHPSLQGHARLSRRAAKLVPFYAYDKATFFRCDGAPALIAAQRETAFNALADHFKHTSPQSLVLSEQLQNHVSDAIFIENYRVPFQFRDHVKQHLKIGSIVNASSGMHIQDLDGETAYDLSGAYGVNVFGTNFYKTCLKKGYERAQALGPVLGANHPVVVDNAARLSELSGQDEVSFHMSGTEAVMQAVRLARYHSGRSHLVRFSGAYHGWWDGVQVGVGGHRKTRDVYTLRERHASTLKVLRTRNDIACVLFSPFQALHPNASAPGDTALVTGERSAHYDFDATKEWLLQLRQVCSERNIALIFDEVFSGFRLAYGGAQEYFGINADMVTYGKSLGGGLPVGVLCGKRHWMQRFRPQRPVDICFARGTFNAHPYVMTSMHEFLQRIAAPGIKDSYPAMHALWVRRADDLNRMLEERALPVRIEHMMSIWSVHYTVASRYHWMFQYYLRAHGLALSWTGTGRLIMSHAITDEDFAAITQRFIAAAEQMQTDGWWWQHPELTNKAIKRQVLREMLGVRFNPLKTTCGMSDSMPPLTEADSRS